MMMKKTMEEMTAAERAWVRIDLDAAAFNFKQAGRMAGGSEVMPVVKADAYGHGVLPMVRTLIDAGARRLAVATPQEALGLKNAGIDCEILVLGAVPTTLIPQVAAMGVAVTVPDMETARRYHAALGPHPLIIHVKLDTGMSRLGFQAGKSAEAAAQAVREIGEMPGFFVEGMFSHMASADDPAEREFTLHQLELFRQVDCRLREMGVEIPVRHCAASAAVIQYKESHLDLVRPGLIIYGIAPEGGPEICLPLCPVMSVHARVVQVKTVEPGTTVSYGRAFRAESERKIATVSIGYADGLMRAASGKIDMLVKGRRAHQVGRICMDMCMLDVTDIEDVCPGDRVTVFGADGDMEISVAEQAAHAGTIPYEMLCAVGKRVPRLFVRDGYVVDRICSTDHF